MRTQKFEVVIGVPEGKELYGTKVEDKGHLLGYFEDIGYKVLSVFVTESTDHSYN